MMRFTMMISKLMSGLARWEYGICGCSCKLACYFLLFVLRLTVLPTPHLFINLLKFALYIQIQGTPISSPMSHGV